MTASILKQIDADIAAEEAAIKESNAKIAKLRAAREVVAGYGDLPEGDEESPTKISLADRIETVLREQGPLDSNSIYEAIESSGHSTTANAVSTTLSRMKAATRLTNESGKWELTKRRRLI